MSINLKTKIQILLIAITIVFQSCQFFEKKQSKDMLLQKELKRIDWKEVDEYPSIGNCDILEDKQQQRQCFFEFLKNDVQHKLDSILVFDKKKKIDSIRLKIAVNPDSQLIYEVLKNDTITTDFHMLDSVLKTTALQFKNLKPALKRGIPVKIQFEIPIVVNKN